MLNINKHTLKIVLPSSTYESSISCPNCGSCVREYLPFHSTGVVIDHNHKDTGINKAREKCHSCGEKIELTYEIKIEIRDCRIIGKSEGVTEDGKII